MRKILILLGSSASGKTTWVKKHHLENYALSADTFRQMYGCESLTAVNGQIRTYLHSEHEKPIWDAFYEALKTRLSKGQFTIIDNTNTNYKTLAKLRKLVKNYHYEAMTIDFMPVKRSVNTTTFAFAPSEKANEELPAIKQIFKNNLKRHYPVSDSVIRNQIHQYNDLWERIKKRPTDWSWLNVKALGTPLQEKQIKQFITCDKIINLDQYKKIQVIGDIHNDYSALMKVFDQHEPGTAYVFLGDYLDKGNRPYSVFNFLMHDLLGSTNLFFIRGNHEDMWQKYLTTGKVPEQFEKSFWVLQRQYSKKKLRNMLNKALDFMHDYYIFRYHGKLFYASHAGFEPVMTKEDYPINLMPSSSLTYGVANNFKYHDPYGRNIDAIWSKADIDCYNLHGHRNNFNEFANGTSYNLNLEGHFRWLTITPDGLKGHDIKSIDSLRFDQAMAYDPYIKVRNLTDNIKAYNFTPEAFVNGLWNKHTSSARGLFIRQSDHKIVRRGFPKFFEIGQTPDAKISNLEFPVTVARKHDGFLCLVCYDQKLNKIHIYSKAGETDMAILAKEDLAKSGYLDKIKHYFNDKMLRDTTLLFEIVDPMRDHHIVYYEKPHIYPLAIISNDQQGKWISQVPDEKHKQNKIFRDWCINEIDSSSWIDTIDQIDDTQLAHRDAVKTLKRVINEDEAINPYREGVVLYGQNMMLKVKFKYYHRLKELKMGLLYHIKRGEDKQHWLYGGRDWYRICQILGFTNWDYDTINEQIPSLGIKLVDFNEKYNIKRLLGQLNAGKIGKNQIRTLWEESEQ